MAQDRHMYKMGAAARNTKKHRTERLRRCGGHRQSKKDKAISSSEARAVEPSRRHPSAQLLWALRALA